VLPSVGDKKPPNFAIAGTCTLSEYFSSSYLMVYTGADGAVTYGLEPVTYGEMLNYLQQSNLLEKYQVFCNLFCTS